MVVWAFELVALEMVSKLQEFVIKEISKRLCLLRSEEKFVERSCRDLDCLYAISLLHLEVIVGFDAS